MAFEYQWKMPQPQNMHDILTPMIGSTPIPNLSPELQDDHDSSVLSTPSPDRGVGGGENGLTSQMTNNLSNIETKSSIGTHKKSTLKNELISIIDTHQKTLPELNTIQASLEELKRGNTARIQKLEEYLRKLKQQK